MTSIFISHSKRDIKLVRTLKTAFENIDIEPILFEYVNPRDRTDIAVDDIRDLITTSDYIFVFLTDNVNEREHTRNWVSHEIGIASGLQKEVFVVSRSGETIRFPIPYLNHYIIIDPDDTEDIARLQAISKDFRKSDVAKGALIGGAIGAIFGPAGTAFGALIGGWIGGQKEFDPVEIQCPYPNCNTRFWYYSPEYDEFDCPSCLKSIIIGD